MQMLWRASTGAVIVALVCGHVVLAEGKGKGGGLARALSKAGGQGSASAGLGRASQNLSRSGNALGRSGLSKSSAMRSSGLNSLGLGKAPAGATIGQSPALADAAARHQQQLQIEQRNRDHRLSQAQHLREIAEKNGDANLVSNADRMAAFAQEHYEARVAQLGRFGVTDPALTPPTTPPPTTSDQPPLPTAP